MGFCFLAVFAEIAAVSISPQRQLNSRDLWGMRAVLILHVLILFALFAHWVAHSYLQEPSQKREYPRLAKKPEQA